MLDRFTGGRAPVDGVDGHGHRKSEEGNIWTVIWKGGTERGTYREGV